MKKILGRLRHTVETYDLIKDGETIAVGISGGKDSMTLLYALHRYQKFSPINFSIHGIKINIGFEKKEETKKLYNFFNKLDIPLTIEETNIKKIVFDIREEKNPCALCANMRRGALSTIANKLGIKKIALGHHKNDRIETFFMNMFYSGRLNTFQMKSYMSRQKITIIRPFYEVDEYLIKNFISKKNMPIIKSNCTVDKDTKREEIKDFLKETYPKFKGSKKSIERALKNKDQFNLF